MLALAAALALHGLVLLMLRPAPYVPIAADSPQRWHVQLHWRDAPGAAPAPPAKSAPAHLSAPPRTSVPPPASPAATAAARRSAQRQPAPPKRPLAPPPAPQPSLWMDANLAHRAPTPVDNLWRLGNLPWPPEHPVVTVRLWISADGRIERFELEGDAARDPQVQRLFAPLADTPMRPAYYGSARVPSTVRVQLWAAEDGSPAPDFLLPLPP